MPGHRTMTFPLDTPRAVELAADFVAALARQSLRFHTRVEHGNLIVEID